MELIPKFSSAQVSLVAHATEEPHKLLSAVETFLGIPALSFSETKTEGHFKNSITLLTCSLSSKNARELATKVISLLKAGDIDKIEQSLHHYSDEKGNLYLRIDKQHLCQGKITLGESDAVRIRFRPVHRYKPSGNFEMIRGLISSSTE